MLPPPVPRWEGTGIRSRGPRPGSQAGMPASQPHSHLASHPVTQPASQQVSQLASQEVARIVSQSNSMLVREPSSHADRQPGNKPVSQAVSSTVNQVVIFTNLATTRVFVQQIKQPVTHGQSYIGYHSPCLSAKYKTQYPVSPASCQAVSKQVSHSLSRLVSGLVSELASQ